MKVLYVNFQSAKNKKEEIANLIDSPDPLIIIGSETLLNSSVHRIIPANFDVIRKDRSDSWGGVLLDIKKDFVYDHVKVNIDAEWIIAKFTMPKNKTLIVGSLYRQTNNDVQYLDTLC